MGKATGRTGKNSGIPENQVYKWRELAGEV